MYKIAFNYFIPFVLLSIIGIVSCSDNTKILSPNSYVKTSSPSILRNRDSNNFELNGTQWVLVSIKSNEILKGSHISLYFRDQSIWGFSGCNIYGGSYEMGDKGILSISMIDGTNIGCSISEFLDQEVKYYNALQNSVYCYFVGEYLEIEDSKGLQLLVFKRKKEFLMNPADLVGSSWHLVSMNGTKIIENLFITLVFDSESEATGCAGCYDYKLLYKANGDDIDWGMSSSRIGELPQYLENQALDYLDSIIWGANYNLDKDQLEIYTARGEILFFVS